MCRYETEQFQRDIKNLGISLSEKQIGQFIRYYEMLVKWNERMNLTAITEYEDVMKKHFVDSLSIVKILDLGSVNKILDVGTGAGFPGVPLKIAFPDKEVVLLDSLNKRIRFLDHVIEELDLTDIHAIHGRAEDFARKENYREQFELCVSRAVANLSTLAEYCLPYVKIGGVFISYKSGNVDEEVSESEKAVEMLGGRIEEVIKFQLPGTDINRSFVKVKKVKGTSKKYPRKSGIPAKEPIR